MELVSIPNIQPHGTAHQIIITLVMDVIVIVVLLILIAIIKVLKFLIVLVT